MQQITEGKARILIPGGTISRKSNGFYNPEMRLSRDVAVWMASKLGFKKILDANAATGIRAIRLSLETGKNSITACEINGRSFELLKKNILGNNANINALNKDANEIMLNENFDYIDIDPFGSPTPFLSNAIRSITKNGVIALTATDIGCLSGRFTSACIRKYGSRPMPCMFSNELGIRILVHKAIIESEKIGKSLTPIFCHAGNHYYRAYLQNAKKAAGNIGYILLCRKCLNFYCSHENIGICCDKNLDYAGPLWLGGLFDDELMKYFFLIPSLKEESKINSIGYYDTHYMAKKLKIQKIPRIDNSIQLLADAGFKASRTHFCNVGIRSNAAAQEFVKAIFQAA